MEKRRPLSEVSKEIGISTKILRGAIRRGDLKAVQPGISESAWFYVTDSDVRDWLESREAGRRP